MYTTCIHRNNGLENSYRPIPRFVCNIEALIPRALPSGIVLLYSIQPWELAISRVSLRIFTKGGGQMRQLPSERGARTIVLL